MNSGWIIAHLFDIIAVFLSITACLISVISAIKSYEQQKYEFSAQERAVSDIIGIIATLDIVDARISLKRQTKSKVFDDFSKEEERIYNFLASDTFVYLKNTIPENEYVAFSAQLMFLLQSFNRDEHINPSSIALRVRKTLTKILSNKDYMILLETNINKYSRHAEQLASFKSAYQLGNESYNDAENKVTLNKLFIIQEYLNSKGKKDDDVDVSIALLGDNNNLSNNDIKKINTSISKGDVFNRYSAVLETKFDNNSGSDLFNRLINIKNKLTENGMVDYDVELLLAWMQGDNDGMKSAIDKGGDICTFTEIYSKYSKLGI